MNHVALPCHVIVVTTHACVHRWYHTNGARRKFAYEAEWHPLKGPIDKITRDSVLLTRIRLNTGKPKISGITSDKISSRQAVYNLLAEMDKCDGNAPSSWRGGTPRGANAITRCDSDRSPCLCIRVLADVFQPKKKKQKKQ